MDYFNIGSPGYAQVGQDDYYDKLKIEKAVVNLHIEKEYPIPEELKDICYFKWKSFPHDFGTYHELCLIYNNRIVDEWEENDDPRAQQFWDFANKCEDMDFDKLEQECIELASFKEELESDVALPQDSYNNE